MGQINKEEEHNMKANYTLESSDGAFDGQEYERSYLRVRKETEQFKIQVIQGIGN